MPVSHMVHRRDGSGGLGRRVEGLALDGRSVGVLSGALMVVVPVVVGEVPGLCVGDFGDGGAGGVLVDDGFAGGVGGRRGPGGRGLDPHRFRRHHPKWHDGLRGENRKWDRLAEYTQEIRTRLWIW